ncbi:MAG TPA: 30S ribosomal protein S6 [Patescibacteria group bacterium]
MQYEIFYLVGATKESALENIKSQVETIIKDGGGVFLEKEVIEKRKLAYQVQHESHGFYLARRFELAEGEKLQEISQKLNLYPEILRFILSRACDLPELKTKEERIQNSQAESVRVASQERLAKEKNLSAQKGTPKPKSEPEKAKEEENIDTQLKELLNI